MLVELVRKAQSGDAEAYTELVRRFQDAVFATAYQTVLDPEAARDIAQETFVRAYVALGGLRDAACFPAWLMRICRNLAVSHLRRPERLWVSLDHVTVGTRDLAAEAAAGDLVARALAGLPEDNRLALCLFLVDGYSYQEVAELTGAAVTTVKGRIERAKRKLAQEVLTVVEDRLKGRAPERDAAIEAVQQILREAQQVADAQQMVEARALAETALEAVGKIDGRGDELWELSAEALRQLRNATLIVDWPRWTEATRDAIRLFEEHGKPVSDLLRQLGYHGTGLTESEREALTSHAADLAREEGDLRAVGPDRLFQGWLLIDKGRFQRGFALWEQAREAMEGLPYDAWRAFLDGSLEFLALTEGKLDKERRVHWGATCDVVVPEGDRIAFRNQPGFSTHTGVPAEMAKFADGFGLMWKIGWYPHSGPVVGYEETKEVFSFTGNPVGIRAWVESDRETVKVPLGEFHDCLLLRATATESPADANLESRRRELNRTWRVGETCVWFARGIGPLAYRFQSADGLVEHAVLARFECPEQRDEWVPLVQGARWEYVPVEPGKGFTALAVRTLTHRAADGTCYISGTAVGNRTRRPRR